MELAVVLPTYNERENIPHIVARLTDALRNRQWEAIFVDDDSPDGTAEAIAAYARRDSRIRLIHRVGRRGLASACIEGMLATQAQCIAVMDADLQHDERILEQMLLRLRLDELDVVVGTRNGSGGTMGEFGQRRQLLSRVGQHISQAVCRCEISDPMSGFFMLRRSFFMEVVRDLEGGGFKILVDLLASARREVRVGEVGYAFGSRRHGESKLDVVVGIEYLFLIVNKLSDGAVPVRMTLFVLVGAFGLLTHMTALLVLTHFAHIGFVAAQFAAVMIAMAENFLLNNWITFRDRRFRGLRLLQGAARFALACSFGAWADVTLSSALVQEGRNWYLAGLAGIVLGSVWNLSISSVFTWRGRRQPARTVDRVFEDVLEGYR